MLILLSTTYFTSIGGVFSERGGVVNVGLEGIMVMGAFSGLFFNLELRRTIWSSDPLVSLLVAGIGWALSSLSSMQRLQFISVRDHVVSGTVLN